MPMNWPIPRIVACAHVQHSVSDSLQVKNEFGKHSHQFLSRY